MRIGIATHFGRVAGGVEVYLDRLIPALEGEGHEVALLYDSEGPVHRPAVHDTPTTPRWSVEALGEAHALDALRAWRPDVIFCHGIGAPTTERALLTIAPGVLYAHAYHGTCISGWKSRLSPTRAPCARTLAWPCLVHYLPRRCGGLNPFTMIERYRIETGRRDTLGAYQAIVTASTHMRAEYCRYGIPDHRVHVAELMVAGAEEAESESPQAAHQSRSAAMAGGEWHLVFIGRLTDLKGVSLLIDALEHVRRRHDGPIVLTIVGDGSIRDELEAHAHRACARLEAVTVRFVGWVGDSERREALRQADLLVVPSVWPEPFGLVGPEAGLLGVPAAAFAVGGIPDWLRDGVSGHLARGRLPGARSLADAIVRCLRDPAHHARLREGARAGARRYTLTRHLSQLLPILESAAASR